MLKSLEMFDSVTYKSVLLLHSAGIKKDKMVKWDWAENELSETLCIEVKITGVLENGVVSGIL